MVNTILYVDSAAGGAGDGSSWANAFTTLIGAITASGTTGTDFYIKNTYTQTVATNNLPFKGAAATPDRVFSCGSTNSPPTTADLSFGAAFVSSTSTATTITGYVYIYGCQFTVGSGANAAQLNLGNNAAGEITLDTCKYIQGGTSASFVAIGGNNNLSARVNLINTTFKFANANSGIFSNGGVVRWRDTASAIDGSGTLPSTLFVTNSNRRPALWTLSGVDLSALTNKALTGASVNLDTYQFYDCKLPSGFTVTRPNVPGPQTLLVNSDSGSTTYKQSIVNYQGTLTADTGVYNNASDGVTPMSWAVTTTANCNPQSPFECFDIVQWAAAGTYASSKVYATSATGSLKTNDIWVDVEYLGASYPQSVPATTFGAGSGSATLPQIPQGTTPGNISSGASWATGGLGNNYSLNVPSFTTSAAGYVRFVVKVGKPSLTINIDPDVTIA